MSNQGLEVVSKLNNEFEKLYNAGNVHEACQTYLSDAKVFANDKQVYEGPSQIEKYYQNARSSGNTHVKLEVNKVIQCGQDYMVELSSYKLNNDHGNYVVTWKKENDKWKKLVDIFN
ncbi:unnamed protein product [Didymodactylos carnosus]|nr:unnamed protein product [Didymodactylos carnosus]CAF4441406.1 unnamed protein product [Didymodactylos carnosus]